MKKRSNIKLMDDCEDLIPEYPNFVKSIVDSEDLPLNISRETLQQNKTLEVIRKNLVKKCLDLFSEIAEDRDNLNEFYESARTSCLEEMTSLKDDITGMPEVQKNIYYLTGESLSAVKDSPCLEVLKCKGFGVLLLVDPINQYPAQGEEEAREEEAAQGKDPCKAVKNTLGDKVDKFVVSNRISDSP
ncbi:hypothetical protein FOMPIDRAFT_1049972 [Fomitopsis schrenkii]|uniref:Uncharacterized protein n=1 Tax=Fomitopsis schrenkii TaxID=2126942 RepID=S8E4V3_FOMSC|nr:hypothetical protein FOMPIDRAFT_1049972 [Fomitopsis schrenkii]